MIKVLNSTCIFLIIFLLLFPGCSEKKVISQHPNIIYILADDLGYGDVSSFNPESKIRTPNIDRLAAGGMRFTDAHTSSSVCTPTRYGILTGRYNWRSTLKKGVLWGMSEALIPADRTTVASLLNENGYHTAFIGKWHLGWNWSIKPDSLTGKPDFDDIDYSKPITNAPNSLGFDYAYGHPASLDMPPYVYVENEMVTASPDRVTVDKGKYSWWRKGPTGSDFMHEEVTPNFFNRAVSYIQDQAGNDNPFFLYLALPSPHTPILPTKEWQGASNLLPYADFVMMIDSFMGKLTDAVEQAGISKNTLIIFTSDNGCSPAAGIDSLEAQGHYPGYIYRGHKADIFEGGHRVPFIARWPDKIAKGSTSHHTICTVDLLATCAEIINDTLADDEGEDSYSMLPLFEQNLNRSAFREATVHHSVNGSFALRKGKWKLIMCPGSGGWSFPKPDNALVIDKLPDIQLYNLVDDPGETKNLQAEYPDTVKVLKTLLTTYIVGGRSTPGTPQQNEGSLDDWPQTDFVHE
jgi:arylsulfatase A-like enzyme